MASARIDLTDLTDRTASDATLTDSVYRRIAELFWSGKVAPGDKLSLRGLAEQLGTSPMPVREALRQLAAAGAVEISPQRAARVPVMTVSRFREILNIRLLLEGLAVVQAAPRISKATLREARMLAESFETEIKKPRPNRGLLVQRNQQLHFAIYRAADAPLLLGLIERMWLLHGPVVNYDLRQSSDRLRNRPAIAHHERLVRALETGRADDARRALTADLIDAAEIIIGAGQFLDDTDTAHPLDAAAIVGLSASVREALLIGSPAPGAAPARANHR